MNLANPHVDSLPTPMSEAWLVLLRDVLARGRRVSPRGRRTLELPQHTVEVDARRPVLLVPERKLSYQFMAAEASWILSGDDLVANIAPWNKRIAEFSDDGVRFFGAYGPKVAGQLDYVVAKLIEDPDSRQAGLTIWRECPPKTKDVPCTVAMFFSLRDPPRRLVGTSGGEMEWEGGDHRRLETNVFMRSNDVWLGTPYDVFNFSMVAHLVCARLNVALGSERPVEPGVTRLTAASSHLYEQHWEEARAVVEAGASGGRRVEASTPEIMFNDPMTLRLTLLNLRDSKPGDIRRWWEVRP